MPRGLCIDKPQSVALREYEDAPLTEDQLRIRTEFASIKHGTEFHLFSGQSPFGGRCFDPALRLFVEDGGAKSQDRAVGQFVGNMAVGVVTEAGTAVTRFRTGDRVYCCNGHEVLRWKDPRVSNVPSILMFILPTGGWDNTPLVDSRLPAEFAIDYVRVWQRKDLASAPDSVKEK